MNERWRQGKRVRSPALALDQLMQMYNRYAPLPHRMRQLEDSLLDISLTHFNSLKPQAHPRRWILPEEICADAGRSAHAALVVYMTSTSMLAWEGRKTDTEDNLPEALGIGLAACLPWEVQRRPSLPAWQFYLGDQSNTTGCGVAVTCYGPRLHLAYINVYTNATAASAMRVAIQSCAM